MLFYLVVLCMCGHALVTAESQDVPSMANALLKAGSQDWGYVDVRTDAHMFWWLFETKHSDGADNRPLILWLQGGPGNAASGFGNFDLIGPVNLNMEARNTSWVEEASLLLVDNPVGAGYSYVDTDSAYTTNIDEITEDLLTMMSTFLDEHQKFKTVPFYIIGQSYGGKMTAAFAQTLYRSVQNGNIECNMQGVAMGNSWISPIDTTTSWASLLLEMSVVDLEGHDAIQSEANEARAEAEAGNWLEAANKWGTTEGVVHRHSASVDFYNLQKYHAVKNRRRDLDDLDELQLTLPGNHEGWAELMNGPVREYLGIIPDHISWGANIHTTFYKQFGDFMKPVYHIVSDLLEETDLHVVVYQGQMDIICCTMGALKWVQRMDWSGLENYNNATRRVLREPDTGMPEMFVKGYDNFDFYWVLGGGHSVPRDQPEASLRLLQNILAWEKAD